MTIHNVTSDTLTHSIDFDCPFEVIDSTTIDTDPQAPFAPDVSSSNSDDVEVSDTAWKPLTGYTGQYSYSGAIMHPSEQLGGGLAEDVLARPGTYVMVEVRDEDGTYPEGDAIGWSILRLNA